MGQRPSTEKEWAQRRIPMAGSFADLLGSLRAIPDAIYPLIALTEMALQGLAFHPSKVVAKV